MQPILDIQDLTRSYENFTLDHICLSIPGGTIMGLVGENGAGKTTTIRAILGLIQRDCGTVTFCGQPLETDSKALKEDIGVVFDTIAFYDNLTPEQVGTICRHTYRNWDDGQYQNLLTRFGLNGVRKEKLKTFSRGMKMKLSIATALSHHPKLLLLDEPTGGLDPVVRDDLLELFLEFVQDEKHAILLSSHITTDLEKIADYVTFLHAGKLLLSKPKDELIDNYGIVRCGKEQFEAISSSNMLAWRKQAYAWEVLVSDRELARRKFRDAVIDRATLDEILLFYVKGEVVS